MNDKYLDFAKALSKEAGSIMKTYFGTEHSLPSWKKANDPVTFADKSINSLVIDKIKASYPEHGVLGEEEVYKTDSQNLWVVDPVDGTIPFILGLPISTFLIALVVGGRPRVAVAYNPWIELMYYAQEGGGAYRNDVKLQITKPATKFVEFIHWRGSPYWEELKGVQGRLEAVGLSPQNFAGGNSRYGVADNRLYGVIFSGKDPWDTAVLDLLVHEAGGKVTDLEGKQLDFRNPIHGTVAGSKIIHSELMDIIKR
jgi:fructose-1,6-bisphosphatase/inositol monophosphatase family enzyme